MNDLLEKRVRTIEKRLDRVEQRLHLGPMLDLGSPEHSAAFDPTPIVPTPTVAPVKTFGSIVEEQEAFEEARLQAARPSHAVPPPLPQVHPPLHSPIHPSTQSPLTGPPSMQSPPRVTQYRPIHSRSSANDSGLEQMIGLKWAGWIGAVVLLIGAALGVKYAYDQHWFAALPVWLWPSIIAAIGLSLIGAGEVVYRKVHVIPAASLFGAGIATLFLDSYVGHSYYALYSPTTAFVLMAITTWIGSAVAMRGRMVSIAVLSQIGGSIAPMVMGDSGAPHTAFMTYLLMLEVIALVLAWWGRSPRWWTLRGVSLATTTLWMTAIIVPGADGQLPMWFAIGFAAIYQLETILSSMRADTEPQWTHIRHNGAAFTTFVTAALTAATLSVLHGSPTMVQASWMLIFALVNGVLGLTLPTKDRPLTRALTVAYRACAVALLALAVPVGMRGLSVEISWAFLAIVLAIIGWYLKSGISRGGSVVVWIAALVHLAMSLPDIAAINNVSQMRICMNIDGVAITSATALAWGLALVGQIIAELYLSDGESAADKAAAKIDDRAAAILSMIASGVWVLTSLFALPPIGATLMLLVYAWLMGGVASYLPRLRTSTQAIAILMFATMKWMIFDTLYERAFVGWPAAGTYIPFVNATIDLGLLLAASLIGLGWLRRKSGEAGRVSPASMLGLLVIAWAITFEVDRAFSSSTAIAYFKDAQLAKQVAFSIVWSIFAVLSVAAGFRIRLAGLRYFGLALLAFTLLKVVTVDLAQVSTGYRILSFLGLGAILLGTSVLYGKLSPRLLGSGASAEDTQSPAV